jgi:hypothetical protein
MGRESDGDGMSNLPEDRQQIVELAKYMFMEAVAPWHYWFAWFPVKTWDGRLAWLSFVKRQRYHTNPWLDGCYFQKWVYSL